MVRYVLAFLAAAVLCTAVLAQEVTPAHKDKNGDYYSRYSTYNSETQRYRPVKCGKNLCLYRIKAWMQVETYNRNQPNPATFATTVAVYTGSVVDYAANVTTGSFEVSGIATTQPAGPTDSLNVLESTVFEFGPDRNDALTASGLSKINPTTLSIVDSDMPVTGGAGQFFGAYGAFADRSHPLSENTRAPIELTFYVPSNKL